MSVSMLDNISYLGKKPDNARSQFDTIAEMAAFSENYLPDIYDAFNLEDGKKYRFNRSNDADETLGKWREIGEGGSADLSSYYTITQTDKKIKAVQDAVDTNTTNIATNTDNISTNATNIATNASDIADIKTKLSTDEADISTLKTDVATNTTNIAANKTSIESNATKIGNLETSVATNTTNIATNKTNIDTNTTDIASLTNRVATNETDIADLKTASSNVDTKITDLETRVSANETNIGDVSTFKVSSWTDLVSAINYNYDKGLKSITYSNKVITLTLNDGNTLTADLSTLISETKLEDLNDVGFTDIVDGQALTYDATSSTWKNSTIDLQGTLDSAKQYTDEQLEKAAKETAYSIDAKPTYANSTVTYVKDGETLTYDDTETQNTPWYYYYEDGKPVQTKWIQGVEYTLDVGDVDLDGFLQDSDVVSTYTGSDAEDKTKIPNLSALDALNALVAASLSTKVNTSDIVDNLTSTEIDKPLSANQGKVLKDLVDTKLNVSDVIDNLTSDDIDKPLSASQGKILKAAIDSKSSADDIIDNLTSEDTDKSLSANQGKVLKDLVDTKVNTSDIVDNLTTADATKPLSANQGKVISDALATKVNVSDIVNNLTSEDVDKPLSANQGKILNDAITDGLSSKLSPDDVIDSLASTDTTKPLSANQGNVLNTAITDGLAEKLDIQQSVDDAGKAAIVNSEGKITFQEISDGSTTAENVSYENTNYADWTNVKLAIDGILEKMDYVEPQITSLTMNVDSVNEVGSSISSITFNWTYNKDVVSQSLTDNTLADETARTATYTPTTAISANKTFTLTASDGTKSVSKSVSVYFRNKIYWGAAATVDIYNSAFILALSNSNFATSYKGSYTMTIGAGQYGFITFPSSFGTLSKVKIGGFDTELESIGDISFTNSSGGVVTYSIYKTTQANLGTITMVAE